MFAEQCKWLCLGEHVAEVVRGSDGMYCYFPTVHMLSKVVVFDVEVLGTRTHFVISGHLDRTRIVLKHTAVYLRRVARYWKPALLHFFEETHQWDGFT
jgi:hypothetical protein